MFINTQDDNIIFCGLANSNSPMSIGDGQDGYIIRLGQTGTVEWASTYFGYSSTDETIRACGVMGSYVYGIVDQTGGYYNAIIKMTYSEGKMIWSKSINFYNAVDSTTIT